MNIHAEKYIPFITAVRDSLLWTMHKKKGMELLIFSAEDIVVVDNAVKIPTKKPKAYSSISYFAYCQTILSYIFQNS